MKLKLVLLVLIGFLSSFDLVKELSLGLDAKMAWAWTLGQQGASSIGLGQPPKGLGVWASWWFRNPRLG